MSRLTSIISESSTTLLPSPGTFYNPVQQFNRDISCAVIRSFLERYTDRKGEKIEKPRMLEALSATGLRSIRFAKEIPQLHEIVANDLSEDAFKAINANIIHNNVQDKVKASHADAVQKMYASAWQNEKFHVIDLDPYGSAHPFVPSAIAAIQNGGLLCVTATDMAVLAGAYGEVCYTKYDAVPLKAPFIHEQAIRILLNFISKAAAKEKKYIEPLISLSIDFYLRVFVRVCNGAAGANLAASKVGMVHQCTQCHAHYKSYLARSNTTKSGSGLKFGYSRLAKGIGADGVCGECGECMHLGGPIWMGPMHDKGFLDNVLSDLEGSDQIQFETIDRMQGMLRMAREEILEPLYYKPGHLGKIFKCSTIPVGMFASTLLNGGFQVSQSHAAPGVLKTDATPTYVTNVMKAFKNRIDEHGKMKTDLPDETDGINFAHHPGSRNENTEGFTRFQMNPTPNWGPGSIAKRVKPDAIPRGEKRFAEVDLLH